MTLRPIYFRKIYSRKSMRSVWRVSTHIILMTVFSLLQILAIMALRIFLSVVDLNKLRFLPPLPRPVLPFTLNIQRSALFCKLSLSCECQIYQSLFPHYVSQVFQLSLPGVKYKLLFYFHVLNNLVLTHMFGTMKVTPK